MIFTRLPTLPRCLRCKTGLREPVRPQDTATIAALARDVDRLVQGGGRALDRAGTARLFLAHRQLVLAQKGRHCRVCLVTALAFAREVVDALTAAAAVGTVDGCAKPSP